MGKLTKKDRIKVLEWQVKTLIQSMAKIEKWSDYADNMLTELNHALPDPEYDAKCEAAVAGVEASLDRHRERLGLNKPQLKQLDQSVFDGLDEKWRFAAVCLSGKAILTEVEPIIISDGFYCKDGYLLVGTGYDTTDWHNSLIERDTAKESLDVDLSSELTGSDLARAMLERGDKYVMCLVFDDIRNLDVTYVIRGYNDGYFHTKHESWKNAIPINNQGEPLTASEAGF